MNKNGIKIRKRKTQVNRLNNYAWILNYSQVNSWVNSWVNSCSSLIHCNIKISVNILTSLVKKMVTTMNSSYKSMKKPSLHKNNKVNQKKRREKIKRKNNRPNNNLILIPNKIQMQTNNSSLKSNKMTQINKNKHNNNKQICQKKMVSRVNKPWMRSRRLSRDWRTIIYIWDKRIKLRLIYQKTGFKKWRDNLKRRRRKWTKQKITTYSDLKKHSLKLIC